ncbi:MAG: antiterminator LoaP [Treponemataceae bacterium]
MNYYAVQVQTSKEEYVIAQVLKLLQNGMNLQNFIFPKRVLSIRRQGITKNELKPLFPGYFFIKAEEIDRELYNTLRFTKGFFRFLKSNKDITPLSEHDLKILQHFMQFGTELKASKVFFDENQRICVKEGPLKGFEGMIVKVDKRKKRAKIKMDFANESMLIDLAFELIEENKK